METLNQLPGNVRQKVRDQLLIGKHQHHQRKMNRLKELRGKENLLVSQAQVAHQDKIKRRGLTRRFINSV